MYCGSLSLTREKCIVQNSVFCEHLQTWGSYVSRNSIFSNFEKVDFLDPSCRPIVMNKITARALATYLIPGCVGRGVRLGSENSSGGDASAARHLEIWNLEIWEFGDLGTWKSRNAGSKQSQKSKLSESKSILPKM